MKEQNSVVIICNCRSCGRQLLQAEIPQVPGGFFINGFRIKECSHCSGEGQKSQPPEPTAQEVKTARCKQWCAQEKTLSDYEILKRNREIALQEWAKKQKIQEQYEKELEK